MKSTVGIIGFGRFGQLSAKHLKEHFEVYVCDREKRRDEAKRIGVNISTLQECAGKDIIVLSVPISDFESVVKEMLPNLKPGALVLDVCSVKEYPIKVMDKLIPKECECIGTHPLFGPDTAQNNLKEKKIVLCPIRTKRLAGIKKFLNELGLKVIVAEPEDHDFQMARSLALIHLLGRALEGIGLEKIEMATSSHEMFLDLMNIANNDSMQLFFDIQRYNRFAKGTRKELIANLTKMDSTLDLLS